MSSLLANIYITIQHTAMSGGRARENRGKLTWWGHPNHTRGAQQTRHHFAINVPNTEHKETDEYVLALS